MTAPHADSPNGAISVGRDTAVPEATPAPRDLDTEQTQDADTADSTEVVDESTADGANGDAALDVDEAQPDDSVAVGRRVDWPRVLAYGVLPVLALALAVGAGFFKWQDSSASDAAVARSESVQVAKDSTTELLSYKPDTVEQQLGAARDLLTGDFRDSYTSLTHDVVIPGAKQQQISAVAAVPAAASVSASPSRAVVLVFVDQSVVMGKGAPTETASTVRVTLDKVGSRWLISGFDPV
jgi:Mce-associated membrane protein